MRLTSLLVAISLFALAPAAVRAEEEVPVPEVIVCPAPLLVEGVLVAPDEAPADCVYPSGGVPGDADPCLPDASGAVWEGCESGPTSCWISSDGATNCPVSSEEPAVAVRRYAIDSVTLTGEAPIAVTGELSFYEDRLHATVGCNSIGGSARIAVDGGLAIGELFSTEMYCEQLAAAEAALIAVLVGDRLSIDDERLSSAAGTIGLTLSEGESLAASGGSVGSLLLLLSLPLLIAFIGIAIGLSSKVRR